MATGDTLITMSPLQYAEYTTLRAKLAEAERERDHWLKEFRDAVDAGVEAIRKAREERDRYRAALTEYADPFNWTVGDHVGALSEWVGSDEGTDLAIAALTPESEATDGDK